MKTASNDTVRRLRKIIDEHHYGTKGLRERFGISGPPKPVDRNRVLHLTREITAENALVRLFLLGSSLARESTDVLPRELLDLALETGLIDIEEGRILPRAVIVPIEQLLFASDAFSMLGSDRSGDFVVPASTHAANFLRQLTLREPVGTTLDLGCGCGIQALFAAAHSQRVVATDISESAVGYARFNAALNGIDNIDCRAGDRLAPVKGEKFDLIVSNPPFVPGPAKQFVYRDSDLDLDEFCRQLLTDASNHLYDGGCLQLLFESVEIEGQNWPDRIRSWVRGTGCDAWVLHSPPVHPLHYAARRLADVDAAQPEQNTYEEWVGYFESRRVAAIHPAMITLRKRKARNWVHFHGVVADIDGEAGGAVRAGLRACDLLDQCAQDDALLGARLRLSPALRLEQQFARDNETWSPERSLLWMNNGLRMDAEVDMQIIAFLHQIHPDQTLRETIDGFGEAVSADPAKLVTDLLPVVRLFIGRGFIESASFD